jgi:hypothetical protein
MVAEETASELFTKTHGELMTDETTVASDAPESTPTAPASTPELSATPAPLSPEKHQSVIEHFLAMVEALPHEIAKHIEGDLAAIKAKLGSLKL